MASRAFQLLLVLGLVVLGLVLVNLYGQGKYADAQSLFQKALELQPKVLGEKHPDTALAGAGGQAQESLAEMASSISNRNARTEIEPIHEGAAIE